MTKLTLEVSGQKAITDAIKAIKNGMAQRTADALNETTEKVIEDEKRAMRQQLDRPTPWTLKAFARSRARRGQTNTRIFIRDNQARYLRYAIVGGTQKDSIVPARRTRLNKYGNLAGMRGGLNQMARRKGRFKGEFKGTVGVWRRTKKAVKLIARVKPTVTYRKRYDFFGVGQRSVEKHYKPILKTNLTRLLPK